MKLKKIVDWLDRTLRVADFDDVSNNGVQVARTATETKTVAFAVDASLRAVEAAAKAGAELLVVHHGISWGGGIRRLDGGVYEVVKAALAADLAIYACHLPLDAHPTLGNNAQLAKFLGLKRVKPAFTYHGNVIGLVGNCSIVRLFGLFDDWGNESIELKRQLAALAQGDLSISQSEQSNNQTIKQSNNVLIGVCSGGAGEFAEEAKRLGCDVYLTGEASWGDVIAAENCGMKMLTAGHYETEVFGVRAVAGAMARALKVKTVDLTESLR